LAKYVCWKFWLARNKARFVGELNLPVSVANREVILLSKHFSHKKLPHASLQSMDNMERA